MNKIVILSDIHANLTALKAVMHDISLHYAPDGIVLLGDLIDYGMRPNEVIEFIENIEIPTICNLRGNHEQAILDDSNLSHFSSDRGRSSLNYTKKILSPDSLSYILSEMNPEGKLELVIADKKILFVHGNIDNPHWGKLTVAHMEDSRYSVYDYVISGHTHIPHCVDILFTVDNPDMRNKKKTLFLNPGSVGQPRNHHPYAQYVYLDLNAQIVHHNAVLYDIEAERILYPNCIDPFYKDRLLTGI